MSSKKKQCWLYVDCISTVTEQNLLKHLKGCGDVVRAVDYRKRYEDYLLADIVIFEFVVGQPISKPRYTMICEVLKKRDKGVVLYDTRVNLFFVPKSFSKVENSDHMKYAIPE